MQNHVPQPGERYRHFKNKDYQIVAIAKHSETGEEMVVYQALYDNFEVYVRPLSMFLEEIDRSKYPNATQQHRFERITDMQMECYRLGNAQTAQTDPSDTESAESIDTENTNDSDLHSADTDNGIHPSLMAFLDADSDEERYRIVSSMEDIVDNHMIDTMAVVLDLVIDDGELLDRYQELKRCLRTRIQFEAKRLR